MLCGSMLGTGKSGFSIPSPAFTHPHNSSNGRCGLPRQNKKGTKVQVCSTDTVCTLSARPWAAKTSAEKVDQIQTLPSGSLEGRTCN